MKLPIHLRHSLLRPALLCAGTLAVGLLLPVYSTATANGSRAEERAAHVEERAKQAEERATRRAEEEAARAQEREARSEERAARRNARGSEHGPSGESGETGGGSGVSTSAAEPNTQPSEKAERGCLVSIQASSQHVIAGETATVSGTLTCPTSANAADQPIAVYQRQSGDGALSFSIAGTVTTEADGSYVLTSAALDTNTVFQVREGRHGAHTVVKVAPRITLALSFPTPQASAASGQSPSTKRAKATFTGTVTPLAAGARVALQVAYPASSEHWRTVAFGRVASDGSYAIEHGFRIPGAASVRTLVHTGKANAVGISEPISYEAPQPQNPQLTIETSADPTSYGQQVTIGGVAAGAANQPVKLLARTNEGSFAVVAEGETEASGDYTFTQEPLQNTTYRVIDATERSTTLFEGVGFALTTAPAPSTAQVGQRLTFTGTLTGAPAGQVVDLERGSASGTGFHVVGTGTVDAASQYQIGYTFDRAGACVMRVKVPGGGLRQVGASAPFTITVTG